MSLAIPQPGYAPSENHRPKRHAAAIGLAGAVLVMLLSLTAFVGGAGELRARGATIGQRAIDFSLRAPDQQRVRLDQFRGQTVLLAFALPDDLPAGRLPANVAVLFVTPGPLDAGDALAARLGRPVIALEDVDGEVALNYDAANAGSAVVISTEGLVADRGGLAEMLLRLGQTQAQARH